MRYTVYRWPARDIDELITLRIIDTYELIFNRGSSTDETVDQWLSGWMGLLGC